MWLEFHQVMYDFVHKLHQMLGPLIYADTLAQEVLSMTITATVCLPPTLTSPIKDIKFWLTKLFKDRMPYQHYPLLKH